MTKFLTVPLLGLAGAATKAFAGFEQALIDVSTLITGDTVPAMSMLTEGVLDLLKVIPKSEDELGTSLYAIFSAGINEASDALLVLDDSARLAVAGLGETEQATELMTIALNAYGIEADESGRVSDVLFKTVKNGITTVAKMSEGFGAMAGNASAAKIAFEDAQAATAALSAVTGKTAESQVALKRLFGELTVDGGKLDSALVAAGGSLKQLNDLISQEGLVSGMESLRDKLGLTNTEFKNMFSSAPAGIAVFQLLTTANENYKTTLDDMINGTNAITEAFDKQTKSGMNQYQLLKNNLNVALIRLGSAIMPLLIPAAQKLAEIIESLSEKWSKLSPATQKMIIIFGGIIAILGPLLIILGILITSIGTIIGVIGAATAAVSTFIVALTAVVPAMAAILAIATPFLLFLGAAALALAGVGAAVWQVVKNWEEIKFFFSEFQFNMETMLSYVFGRIKFWMVEKWDEIIAGITDKFNIIISKFQYLKDVIVGNSIIPDMVKQTLGWVNHLSRGMTSVWTKMIDKIVKAQKFGAKEITRWVRNMMGEVAKAVGTEKIFEGFVKIAESIYPPNPALATSGGAMVAKGTALYALGASMSSGGGGGKGGGGSSSGGGGGAPTASTVPGQDTAETPDPKKTNIVVDLGEGVITDPKEFSRKMITGLNEAFTDDIHVEFTGESDVDK
jgi:TP901 family phage tail tape measure protein